MLSKEKEGSIYPVSPMWTGPQSNQKVNEEISIYTIFCLLNEKRIVTGPKSVCLMLLMAKTQNIRVWSKDSFISREGAKQEDGSLSSASNPYSQSTNFRFLLCQGKGTWEGQKVIDRYLSASRGYKEDCETSLFLVC